MTGTPVAGTGPYVVVDVSSGDVVSVADELVAWSGYDVSEIVGRPLWQTLAGEDLAARLRAAHADAIGLVAESVLTGTLVARDGAVAELCLAQTLLRDGQGRPTHLVLSSVAVAPASDFAVSGDQATALDRITRGLLENLSHELRTPVASVAGYTELLREGEGGELSMMARKFVGAIARNSERLRALTDQLVVIGSLGSSTASLASDPLDLRDVVSAVRVRVATSGLERVTVSLEPGQVPVPVEGDHERLVQAVEELVVNAAKFTLGNGHVSCSLRMADGQAVIEVVDDGLGFDAAEAGVLFLPFHRAESARLRAVPGAGLGLTVVAAVVHSHGGEITATSGDGTGSRFEIRLPLGDPESLVAGGGSGAGAGRDARAGGGADLDLTQDDVWLAVAPPSTWGR